jgi:hypothetical protein
MLHLTKVAFGAPSIEALAARLAERAAAGPVIVTTRFLPKRHAEVAGLGSLYWIVRHQLVARSAILGFGEADAGRVAIRLDAELVRVHARPKRAHQGWRYLEAADAPADLAGDLTGVALLPPVLAGRLAELALL